MKTIETPMKLFVLAFWRRLYAAVYPRWLQSSLDRYERRIIVRNMKKRGPLKLNLGSGDWFRWDYINIDKYNAKTDERTDICRLYKYERDSVDEILLDHVIEHLPRQDAPKALQEWYRILKPGGKMIIRCPNFELYVREWLEAEDEYRQEWGIINIFGHDEEGMYHKNGFTVDILRNQVEETGFKVIEIKITENRFPCDNSEYRKSGDIYCEAVKPLLS